MEPTPPSDRAPALSVVVPTYNERPRIEELIAAVFRVFEASGIDGELIVVDDNSPDGTGAAVDAQIARYGARLRAVHRPGKLGLGSAVMAGFEQASAPVLGVMDADFSHPPEELPRLLAALHQTDVDVVVGSRYVPGGRVEDWPRTRLALSWAACLLARPLTPVRDATSGFFLMRRGVLRDAQIRAGGFKICLELLVRGRARSVAEMPYAFTDRTSGRSKMNVREATGYLRQLWLLLRDRFLDAERARIRHVVLPPRVDAPARSALPHRAAEISPDRGRRD